MPAGKYNINLIFLKDRSPDSTEYFGCPASRYINRIVKKNHSERRFLHLFFCKLRFKPFNLRTVSVEFLAPLVSARTPCPQPEKLNTAPFKSVISCRKLGEKLSIQPFAVCKIIVAQNRVYRRPAEQFRFNSEKFIPQINA